ncbi:2-hydroxychromene-2-carboxylate isomerase [Breoghania sp. L-A4]|uniref:2-hydroxychromene-2-carboxylate isomerase n=1 Tax=Breoghania sp. L-A4 TaxID=2304600 RepID=UPI000E35CBC5|nr:2-hydroxychromene-2-carboxylate isomerase [Breoghania sp. L-A4]AXS39665.1 2-hydroxychromene-2-carboxylate isomerase [Breoghania sp. L-A4]
MTVTLDYYYSHISPWAFLGHDAFMELAKKHGAKINFRPVNLGQVFPETGGLPLAKRHPARQDYRFLELQRWREKRGVPLKLQPAHFPTNPVLVDCTAIVLIKHESPKVADFSRRAFNACWTQDQELADEATIAGILDAIGEDSAAVLAEAKSDEIKAAYEANCKTAIDAGVYGSPSYVLNGEVFFGQDRLDLLDDALSSGRAPYRPVSPAA